MDFIRYAERSAGLLNAVITDVDALQAHLADREWLVPQCTDRDCMLVRKFQRELRPVFEASAADDTAAVIDGINELMVRHPITPQISSHDPQHLHIHAASKTQSVAELLVGEALLGLANLVCDLGPHRLGICAASPCTNVYVDTSPNQSRRYCSDRCSSRANVAAYRARQKAVACCRMNDGPLIVQSDKTLLLEVDHERASDCRKAIAPFAELERSPEHIHTYRLTPLGLWNARAAGHDAEQVVDTLLEYSRYAVPHALLVDVAETMARYGRLRLEKHPIHGLVLVSTDRPVLEEVLRAKKIAGMLGARIDDDTVVVHASERGNLKQALLKLGWPAEDFAGYVDGEAHPISLDLSRLDAARLPARGRGVVLARRLRRRRAPVRGRQDAGRRGRDGARPGDHPDPGHQHRLRAAVEGRAAPPYVADRGRDRRVLRLGQGDPAGHHRDVPGDDHQALRASTATSSCSTPATGG